MRYSEQVSRLERLRTVERAVYAGLWFLAGVVSGMALVGSVLYL